MKSIRRILHRALAGAALLATAIVAAPAFADTDYTDHWQNPAQTGWGVALTQGTNLIYTEIFSYDAGHNPTWFGGTIYRIADGHYAGTLFTVTGDYYGHLPYDPTLFHSAIAGTMDFQASDPSHATFSYTINGVTVTTQVERLTLDGLSIAGAYVGGFVQSLTAACNSSGVPSNEFVPAQIVIGQTSVPGGTVTIQFNDVTQAQPYPLFYTMQGAATQYGKVLDIPSAAYSNPDGAFTPLHVYDVRHTANGGIEGRWKTISGTNDPCVDQGRFTGVSQ
jgi:hypothetical protein